MTRKRGGPTGPPLSFIMLSIRPYRPANIACSSLITSGIAIPCGQCCSHDRHQTHSVKRPRSPERSMNGTPFAGFALYSLYSDMIVGISICTGQFGPQ